MFPFVVACALFLAFGQPVFAGDQRGLPGRSNAGEVALRDLTAVRRLLNPLRARIGVLQAVERAAAWADMAAICDAVAGRRCGFDVDAAFADGEGALVPTSPGVAARDAHAYRLLAVGYSAHETADIITGRITREALDTARRMRAAGLGRERASDYLDREYQRMADAERPAALGPLQPRPSSTYDAWIAHYAGRHGVDAELVRAIVDAESSYSPAAISRAGAIGLMQLMPATARELGVDPYVPEQNIDGGVRYFAALLKRFGGVELALVAYNGGPGYAARYARGDATLYGETRAYVRAVLSRVAAAANP